MGIKTYRRNANIKFDGKCASVVHAQRLHDVIIRRDDCEFEGISPDGLTVSFRRVYYGICGNYPADDPRFERSLIEESGGVYVEFKRDRRQAGKDVPRDFKEIIRKVKMSKLPVPVIEGCAAVPARPVAERLKTLGYKVTTTPN